MSRQNVAAIQIIRCNETQGAKVQRRGQDFFASWPLCVLAFEFIMFCRCNGWRWRFTGWLLAKPHQFLRTRTETSRTRNTRRDPVRSRSAG